MFTKTFLTTAALAGLAAAAPTARQTTTEFGLIALHSTSIVHFSSLNANGGKFWLGKPTASFCPDGISPCPGKNLSSYSSQRSAHKSLAGNETVFITNGAGGVSLAVEVPGGQEVYIDPTDSSLSFSSPHAFPPTDAILTGFVFTDQTSTGTVGSLTLPGGPTSGAFACPTNGTEQFPFQIFSLPAGTEGAGCIGVGLGSSDVFDGAAAWEYT
jgi:hypothetical protein